MHDVEAEPTAADRAELLTTLERELTDKLLREVAEAARPYVDRLRVAGVPVHPRSHHELAQDAAIDTIEGRRAWDGTYPLVAHLHMAVKSRFLNLLKKQKRFRRESLADIVNLEESSDDMPRQRHRADIASTFEVATSPRPSRVASLRDAAEQMLTTIRRVLADDADALDVAAAWERGYTERSDGIAASGLEPPAYDAAVKRIQRTLKVLPDDLRDSAQDAMEISYGA